MKLFKLLSLGQTRLLHIIWVIILVISLCQYLYRRLYDPYGYKQFQKPLKISGMHETRVFPDEQFREFETYFDHSKMIVTEITFTTKKGRRYKVKDLPSDGYFPDDSDGLVDYISQMRRREGRILQSERFEYWKKVPFDEKLYQILTEKYNRALQEQMNFGDVLR